MSDEDPIDSRVRSDAASWRAAATPMQNQDQLLRAAVQHSQPVRSTRLNSTRFLLPALAAAAVVVLAGLAVFAATVTGPHRGSDDRGVNVPASATSHSIPQPIDSATAPNTTSSAVSDPATTATASTTSAPSSTRIASTRPRSSSPTPTQPAGPNFVAGAECQSAQLRLAREPGAIGAGGTSYMGLKLTNISKVMCVTKGYPGLSVIDSSGKTVQHPAERHTGTRTQPVKQVSIDPGQTGYVLWTSVDVVPSIDCSTKFHGSRLRVYPPDNTVPLYVPYTDGFCNLGVGPVTAKDS